MALQLDVQLQKSNEIIKKLQIKCVAKTKEITRLRSALKRSEINRSSLKEVLKEMKDSNIISEECHRMLEVIILNQKYLYVCD